MIWYIAGPMSGVPRLNFPLFVQARQRLTELGYSVVSPTDLVPESVRIAILNWPEDQEANEGWLTGESLGQIIARDIEAVIDRVGGIILLPNWERSRFARLEVFTGLLVKHEFRLYNPFADEPVEFLSTAQVRFAITRNMP